MKNIKGIKMGLFGILFSYDRAKRALTEFAETGSIPVGDILFFERHLEHPDMISLIRTFKQGYDNLLEIVLQKLEIRSYIDYKFAWAVFKYCGHQRGFCDPYDVTGILQTYKFVGEDEFRAFLSPKVRSYNARIAEMTKAVANEHAAGLLERIRAKFRGKKQENMK